MASYPGSVKVFTRKIDLQDTVYAAHVNAMQDEIVAMQQVLGLSPQGSDPNITTVAARLTAIETSFVKLVSDASSETIAGNKTFSGNITFTGRVRATTTYEMLGLSSIEHAWQVGPTEGRNTAFDGRVIQNRDNGNPAVLTLNPFGGEVRAGGNRVLTVGDVGPGNNLNADKLDGFDHTDFATAGHRHAQNFCQLLRTTSMSVPDGNDENDWHDVIFNQTVVHVHESEPGDNASMFNLAQGRFYTPPEVGAALYYFGVRLSFQKDSSVGTRRLRFIDSNGVIFDMMAEEADLMAKDFVSLSGMYYFPGDANFWVKAQVYQDSGSTRSIYANSTSRPFAATWAAVMRRI